jgi:hypothetical protein
VGALSCVSNDDVLALAARGRKLNKAAKSASLAIRPYAKRRKISFSMMISNRKEKQYPTLRAMGKM